jgi:RNA polymerase sigma-70 factor (sigma-E family)
VVETARVDIGDADAEFAAFVAGTSAELGRVAWYLSGDATRAEDLLQQAYLRTWTHWARIQDGDPLAYTRRVLANARIDGWRRSRREVLTAVGDLPERGVPSSAEAHADRDLLVRALRALPDRQRRIVVLRHLVGLSEAQVAADLGVSLGTVKSTASRGLQRLREALDPPPLAGAHPSGTRPADPGPTPDAPPAADTRRPS